MSTLRHRFRYVLDNGDPHDVMTNALDVAAVQGLEIPANQVAYAMLHSCALRLDIPGTPADLSKFIELLDELEDLDGVPVGVRGDELPDPIQSAD